MSLIKAKGIVLKEILVGESDKIIVLLTKELGKISVGAKGARKSKSKFLAGTQLFTYAEYIIDYKIGKYYIKEINIIKNFNFKTYDEICYSSYFVEMIDKVTFESIKSEESLYLLITTFNIILKNILDIKQICAIFRFKLMQISGYQPNITNCSFCQKEILDYNNLKFFIEGIVCSKCNSNIKQKSIIVNYTVMYAISYILCNDIKDIFKFKLDELNIKIFYDASELFLENLELSFKTDKFLNTSS